jgi:hypothetical protein
MFKKIGALIKIQGAKSRPKITKTYPILGIWEDGTIAIFVSRGEGYVVQRGEKTSEWDFLENVDESGFSFPAGLSYSIENVDIK